MQMGSADLPTDRPNNTITSQFCNVPRLQMTQGTGAWHQCCVWHRSRMVANRQQCRAAPHLRTYGNNVVEPAATVLSWCAHPEGRKHCNTFVAQCLHAQQSLRDLPHSVHTLHVLQHLLLYNVHQCGAPRSGLIISGPQLCQSEGDVREPLLWPCQVREGRTAAAAAAWAAGAAAGPPLGCQVTAAELQGHTDAARAGRAAVCVGL